MRSSILSKVYIQSKFLKNTLILPVNFKSAFYKYIFLWSIAMFQTNKLITTQAKAIESAQALAQLAIENAKTIAEIQYDAAKDAAINVQTKSNELLKSKDPKEALAILKTEDVQVVVSEVAAMQVKITKAMRRGNQELVEMLESTFEESKIELIKLVEDSKKTAPAGTEPFVNTFEYLFNASLQSFDQALFASKDIYASFEKTIESTMSSFQNQTTELTTKQVAKSRKAIAA